MILQISLAFLIAFAASASALGFGLLNGLGGGEYGGGYGSGYPGEMKNVKVESDEIKSLCEKRLERQKKT